MDDATDSRRRELLVEINTTAGIRQELEARHGKVWDTDELAREFHVLGFAAPFIVVARRSDGVKGSLMFQHTPRFYFDFTADASH